MNKYDEAYNRLNDAQAWRDGMTIQEQNIVMESLMISSNFEKHKDALIGLVDAGDKATRGEWELWSGSSWRRFGIKGALNPFIYPYNDRHDNHEDIEISTEDSDFITKSANTRSILKELLDVVGDHCTVTTGGSYCTINPGYNCTIKDVKKK